MRQLVGVFASRNPLPQDRNKFRHPYSPVYRWRYGCANLLAFLPTETCFRETETSFGIHISQFIE
jgi:hypothetical protein